MRKNKKISGKSKRRWYPTETILLTLLIIYTITFLFPLLWGVLTSFKHPYDFGIQNNNKLFGLPDMSVWQKFNGGLFGNYKQVISGLEFPWRRTFLGGFDHKMIRHETKGSLLIYIINTLLYAGGSSMFFVFISCSVAYLCAKYKYKFSAIIYATVIFTMVVPIIGAQAAMIKILQMFNLYDNWFGNFLRVSTFTSMYFLVFFAFFKDLPDTFNEAAEIDGANQLKIMYTICMPLAMNMVATVFLITFITYWNDYTTPMLYMPTKPTLSYALLYLMERGGESANGIYEVPPKVAALVLLCLPMIVLFVFFKKRLMGNISMGGIKE